jgi:hypothetical protein
MRAQVATFAGCLIPSQIARSQATKNKTLVSLDRYKLKGVILFRKFFNNEIVFIYFSAKPLQHFFKKYRGIILP